MEVPIYPGLSSEEIAVAIKDKVPPRYKGTFVSVSKYVMQHLQVEHTTPTKMALIDTIQRKPCPLCHGKKLSQEALKVRFGGLDIAELMQLPLLGLARLIAVQLERPSSASLNQAEMLARRQLLAEIQGRIEPLISLGLGHLWIDRPATTLSGGELQRVRLGTQLRSELSDVLYIMDEPSAGLHPADVGTLIAGLRGLLMHGNSIVLVEHNLQLISSSDWLIDIGPGAGKYGGKIMFNGPVEELTRAEKSLSRSYVLDAVFNAKANYNLPTGWIALEGINKRNLRDFSARFPLGVIAAVTGVSGVGKSTLVTNVLVDALKRHLQVGNASGLQAPDDSDVDASKPLLSGDLARITGVVVVDQKPIGRSSKSVLATYVEIFDEIRNAFANTHDAKAMGFAARRFSFNLAEGRCPACEGDGFKSVTLHFMASVRAPCEVCNGSRYNADTLKVELGGKSIAEVLGLTVIEARAFFEGIPELGATLYTLELLNRLGLGYLRIGQATTELSGGEAQRIKLVSEAGNKKVNTVYVLDEPCTGLHPANVDLLMRYFEDMLAGHNSVFLVEHDMRAVAKSDWVIDLDTDADRTCLAAQGTPREVAQVKTSKTAPFLAAHVPPL